jgi:hypothetical protein
MAKVKSESLKELIKSDDEYRKFRKIVTTVRDRLNIEKDTSEALASHASRTSRSLYGNKSYNPRAIVEASLHDLSNRSRLVELRVKCDIQISHLHEAVKSIRKYLGTEFKDALSMHKTIADRSAAIDGYIKTALSVEAEGKALVDMLDFLIKDIDQANFSIRATINALELVDSKGKTI